MTGRADTTSVTGRSTRRRKPAGDAPAAATAAPAGEDAAETAGEGTEAPAQTPLTAEALAPQAIETLTSIMRHGSSEAARIAAANAILDRAWGKARSGAAGGGESEAVPVETRVTVRFV